MKKFDVVVIGSGPGGYIAAIRAAQSGCKVALIEATELGGVCLNWGCIPTKTLIASAYVLHRVKQAEEFGIHVENVSIDFAKMKLRKDHVVQKIKKGLEGLIASNSIEVIRGFAAFQSPREIKITGQDNEIIWAEKTIIATGSDSRDIAAFPVDNQRIHNSTSLLEFTTLPKKLIVIGGGVIGCEFASLYNEFGVEVVIIEALPSILPMEGKAVSEALTSIFKRKGIQIHTSAMVDGIDYTQDGIRVRVRGGEAIEGEHALVAVGRKLNSDRIGLDKAGIQVSEIGAIPVNEKMETSVAGIYAIGDITAKSMLAHVASHQGVVAAQNAIGIPSEMHYNAIPSVIFTYPEVATVGYTLELALEKGHAAIVGRFPFQALGKSQAALSTDGFAQVVVDRNTNEILGAQVIGYEASSLITEITLAIQNELTIDCVANTIHGHPTISEVWHEAAMLALGTPLNFPPMKKKP